MGDLRESVRKVPERIAVRISPLFPRPAGKSTVSLASEHQGRAAIL